MKPEKRNGRIEHAALGASVLCLIHCLALPVLIALLPALASILPIDSRFHLWMLAFALPASGWALLSSHKRHGVAWPRGVGLLGLVCLALGALVFEGARFETIATVLGAVLLATAHVANLRLRHGVR